MTPVKKTLSVDALESQAILELPDRQLLALVVIKNLLNGNTINITVQNIKVGAEVCAVVNALNGLLGGGSLTCSVIP